MSGEEIAVGALNFNGCSSISSIFFWNNSAMNSILPEWKIRIMARMIQLPTTWADLVLIFCQNVRFYEYFFDICWNLYYSLNNGVQISLMGVLQFLEIFFYEPILPWKLVSLLHSYMNSILGFSWFSFVFLWKWLHESVSKYFFLLPVIIIDTKTK